jgi:septum site-determining protein MinC
MGILHMVDHPAFKLKGRLYTLTVVQVCTTNKALFIEHLATVVAQAPRLFDNTPVILDCSSLQDEQFDLAGFCCSLRESGMIPVAIQGGPPIYAALADAQGLPSLFASSSHDKPLIDPSDETLNIAAETIKTRLLTVPVRSGQQIVSKGGDLVVTASVSHGAELLADGNIHIYGALRGRALAGIAGDKEARIFCQSLDAELVAIAGYYCVSDAIKPISGPCQIFLRDEHIQIEPF